MGPNGELPLASRSCTPAPGALSGQWQNPSAPTNHSLSTPPSLAESLRTHFPHARTHARAKPQITMPRQSRSTARAPARPTVPARAAPAPTQQQQTRPAATYAPSAGAHPPSASTATPQAPTSQGPGLLGQMASTAAYVFTSIPPSLPRSTLSLAPLSLVRTKDTK